MAQEVGHYENNVEYTEGPFVISNANGWRIESEVKGLRCPTLPDDSIYRLLYSADKNFGKTRNKKLAVAACDWLNAFVAQGRIVLDTNGWWIAANRFRH